MRLLIQSAIIFFGTLLAAALLALGEPSGAATPESGQGSLGGYVPVTETSWHEHTAAAQAAR
jgi:hypothetical protein